jgi:hypothetical protein
MIASCLVELVASRCKLWQFEQGKRTINAPRLALRHCRSSLCMLQRAMCTNTSCQREAITPELPAFSGRDLTLLGRIS